MPLNMMNHHMLSMELPTSLVMNEQLLLMKLPMSLVKVHKLLTLKLPMPALVKVYHVLPSKLPTPQQWISCVMNGGGTSKPTRWTNHTIS
jgi:hypothetical protein